MKIALLGNKGLLGTQFQTHFDYCGQPISSFNRSNFDISAPLESLEKTLDQFELVINCIAYTAVDRAESEIDSALMANATLPANLAALSAIKGFKLVHFSTDYVFDGKSAAPYRIHDLRNPGNAYGRSKSLGEESIESSGARYSIFRTSWLYGEYGDCFPKTLYRLLASKPEISVVHDQMGQPTWTKDVVNLVMNHIHLELPEKIVHATSAGQTTWFDFAKRISRDFGSASDARIVPIDAASYPTVANRPAYSVLSHEDSTLDGIGHWMERWDEASSLVLRSISPRAS